MKKLISLILSLTLLLSFTSCSKAEATWKEQYDLGLKYAKEARYDEAVLAFTKALEIDPKQAPVYIALAEVYVHQGDYTAARSTLDKAVTEIGQTEELTQAKDKLDKQQNSQNNSHQAATPDNMEGVVRTEREDYDDGSYVIMGFDAGGNIICQYNYTADGTLDHFWVCDYDDNGNMIRDNCYNAHGTLSHYNIYTYDASGNRLRSDLYDADGNLDSYWIYTYDDNGSLIREDLYDADGNLIESISASEQEQPESQPDEDRPPYYLQQVDGVVNTETLENEDESKTVLEYGADGKVLREVVYNRKGEYSEIYIYERYPNSSFVKTEFKYKYHIRSVSLHITTFDEKGEKLWANNSANVNATAEPIFNGEGQPYSIVTSNIHGKTTTTDYNIFGDVTREDHRNADGSYAGLWTYEYDENGNKISDTSYDENGNINFQKFY